MTDTGHFHPRQKSPGETPSQKTTGTTRHLQQACPKGLGLTHQRHLITPTLPQTASPRKLCPKQERPKHHITWTPSRPAALKQQTPSHHNQPPKKPQQTRKRQCAHKAQVCIPLLRSQTLE